MDTLSKPLQAAPPWRRSAASDPSAWTRERAGPSEGAGEHAALAERLIPHERALFALCQGMLRHPDDVEDAVQETFLRALRAMHRFRGEASLRTWLCRIAINVCLEWKRGRRPTAPEAALDGVAAPPEAQPERLALGRIAVTAALAGMPVRLRAVLLLKELEGWSVGEIAAALRCTHRRVYHELRLAHDHLAAWRARNPDPGGPNG